MERVKPGDSWTYKRQFTREEILAFAELTGDRGTHHVDREKKLLVHGLLVASLPTKLGGDINFISRNMVFNFLGAVYEGEKIECRGKITKITEQSKRWKCSFNFECFNEKGEKVLDGTSSGMIWKETLKE